jgi:hypothetical protein
VEKVYCACGCGQVLSDRRVRRGARYTRGHHMRDAKLRRGYAGTYKCMACGKEFTRNAHNQIYCQDCRLAFRTCSLCGKVAADNGQTTYHLCFSCESRLRIGENTSVTGPNWKGGRVNREGYVGIYCPDHPRATATCTYVMEHILVWEEAHGQPLPDGWVIHHKNGIRDDNRIENLLAMPKSTHDNYIPKLQDTVRNLEGTVLALAAMVVALRAERAGSE